MSITNSQAVKRYFADPRNPGKGADHLYASWHADSGEVPALVSYGHHFPLALPVDFGRAGEFWLLNIDSYSMTTSRHQSLVRSMVPDPWLPVSFDQLNSALINPQGLRLHSIERGEWGRFERAVLSGWGRAQGRHGREFVMVLIEAGQPLRLKAIPEADEVSPLEAKKLTLEAYEALIPEAAQKAEAAGVPVLRKGYRLFAIETELSTRWLRSQPGVILGRRNGLSAADMRKMSDAAWEWGSKEQQLIAASRLWDGDFDATETVIMPGMQKVYARGTIQSTGTFTKGVWGPLRLGKKWHEVIFCADNPL